MNNATHTPAPTTTPPTPSSHTASTGARPAEPSAPTTTEPTQPRTEPTQPRTEHAQPPTDNSAPLTEPTQPRTENSEPLTEPSAPGTANAPQTANNDHETTLISISDLLRQHPACRPSIPPPEPPRPPRFQFMPTDYFTRFELPADAILVGDCHLTRGDITLIAGVPGCGKSRLLLSLAIAGRQGAGSTWMGLPVHAAFKTFILQAENGEVRLKQELLDIESQGHDLREHLFLTPPPPEGLAFSDPDFCAEVRHVLARERPGVFAIDPWNRAVPDDKARDFREVLNAVQSCLPEGPDKPAIVIVHHLRKGSSGDGRKTGRDLLNEISGSYVIGSACRSAFILEPATPAPEDTRVVFTCAKNNNGPMGPPTAWHRQNGLFEPCAEFDWKEWREGSAKTTISLDDLEAIFDNGAKMLSKSEAARLLQAQAGVGRTAAYLALKPDGRFGEHLSEAGGFLNFIR